MSWLYDTTRLAHLVAGVVALVTFWIPALTRKGGITHRRAGRVYLWAMGVVVATAVPLSVSYFLRGDWEIATFLAYLAVITFSALWAGRRVLDVKASPAAFRSRFHAGVGFLNLASAVAVLALAWTIAPPGFMRILFTAFSVIGFSASWETLRFFRNPPTDRRWWWYEHLGGMIGSGIAAHTAFGAFGMRRLFPELHLGPWGLLPWIAPSVIGTIAVALLTRHYKRRFAPAPAVVAPSAASAVPPGLTAASIETRPGPS